MIVGLNIYKIDESIECTKVEHVSYTTGTCALLGIYALALGPVALGHAHIYQASPHTHVIYV